MSRLLRDVLDDLTPPDCGYAFRTVSTLRERKRPTWQRAHLASRKHRDLRRQRVHQRLTNLLLVGGHCGAHFRLDKDASMKRNEPRPSEVAGQDASV